MNTSGYRKIKINKTNKFCMLYNDLSHLQTRKMPSELFNTIIL